MADSTDTPLWESETVLSAEWLSLKTGLEVESCVANLGDGEHKGFSGAKLIKLNVVLKSGETLKLVIKQVIGEMTTQSKTYGLAREALFYQTMAKNLSVRMPKVYYSFGDWDTGIKVIIMDDLSSFIQAGYFFGPGNPANWGKDLPSLLKGSSTEPTEVIRNAFLEAAKLHSTYWQKEQLLTEKWLRNTEWFQGLDEEGWNKAQQTAKSGWEKIHARI